MEIERYEVGANRSVTLFLTDPPEPEAVRECRVYIGGAAQGTQQIDGDRITFTAFDGDSGQILVVVQLKDGDPRFQLTATSSTSYPPPIVVVPEEQPVFTKATPQYNSGQFARPGEPVFITGRGLANVKGVFLSPGTIPAQIVGAATANRVTFTVPMSFAGKAEQTWSILVTLTSRPPTVGSDYTITNLRLIIKG